MPNIQIDVDDFPVEVDSAEFAADPDRVIAEVRAAREALTPVEDGTPPPPDFRQIDAQHPEEDLDGDYPDPDDD